MNKNLMNQKKFLIDQKQAISICIVVGITIFTLLFATIGFAGNDDAVKTLVDTFLHYVTIIGSAAGGIMVVWGGIQFGMAMKNDEAERLTKHLLTAAAGAVTIAIAVSAPALYRKVTGDDSITGENALEVTD